MSDSPAANRDRPGMVKQEILGVVMVPVECVNVSLLTSYLCQADGVLIVTLRAYSGTIPDACQNAIWAAAGLVEKAISVAEGRSSHDDLTFGSGI